jgi:hypothetical protein
LPALHGKRLLLGVVAEYRQVAANPDVARGRGRTERHNRAVEILRDEEAGFWLVEATDDEHELKPDYLAALPRYLTAFERLAQAAKRVDEAQFVMALLSVRGMQDSGWDPYEMTIQGIRAATRLHNETDDRLAARHLQLWIYGHTLKPRYRTSPRQPGSDQHRRAGGYGPLPEARAAPEPWEEDLPDRRMGRSGGHQAVAYLLPQIWDVELRNAVFHSDYTIQATEIRLPGAGERRSLEGLAILTGKASAYHDGVLGVRRYHLESYAEPKRVRGGAITPGNPDEELEVIVREGEGAIGLKDTSTASERAAGGISFRYCTKVTQEEVAMLNSNPDLARLPARPTERRG